MSWLDNLTRRAQETFESATEALSNLLFGRGKPEAGDNVELPQPDFDPIDSEPTPTYPVEVPAQEQRYQPESFQPDEPEEDTEDDEEPDVEDDDPDLIPQENLRRIFVFLEDAQAYADDIPVPTRVFRRKNDRLYQVEVRYP